MYRCVYRFSLTNLHEYVIIPYIHSSVCIYLYIIVNAIYIVVFWIASLWFFRFDHVSSMISELENQIPGTGAGTWYQVPWEDLWYPVIRIAGEYGKYFLILLADYRSPHRNHPKWFQVR
jgi:hypothetical protein